MKTTIASIALLAALCAAGAASAQTDVGGTAEKYCTLPTTWLVPNVANGANSGQFTSSTQIWAIPESLFIAAATAPGGDTALRIRGKGSCNTSHTIQIRSTNGAIVTTTTAPSGWTDRRRVRYDAFWNNAGAAMGPTASVSSPNLASGLANYVITPATPLPGERDFDIRMTVDRDETTPLVAGTYSDTFTVTLSPTG